jgi:hypothetical protein
MNENLAPLDPELDLAKERLQALGRCTAERADGSLCGRMALDWSGDDQPRCAVCSGGDGGDGGRPAADP